MSAVSDAARPLLTAGQIASWLPSRGAFTFPAPYGTQGVRLTNASDCGGADCVRGVGYSYWRNINNHVGSDTILVFLGLDRTKGGTGPTLFSYSKSTGATKNLGPLFPAGSAFENATGEGWYFSATRPTTLYVNDGPRLLRYDVISHATETVFDARTQFGADAWIWQMHSSNDDRVHSFTLRRTSDWATLGCAAYDESQQRYFFFPARGEFDECQLDKSGRYVVIKENVDGAYGEDNVIEDLQTGTEQILLDQNGAGGHSDTGFGYLVAEDNFNSLPGVVRTWRLDMNTADPAHGRVVFRTTSWSFGDNHIAHANSKPNTAIGQQVVCSSDANRLNLPMANEILCYKLDGSQQVLVVAPVMTNLDAAGGGSDEYWKTPKGNLDVTGEYFLWTSNAGGDRMDAFMVRVPLDKLGATAGSPAPNEPAPTPAPAPSPAPAPDPVPAPTPAPGPTSPAPAAAPVTWTALVNTAVSGSTIAKTGGCDGCADAGAISQQQLASGDGFVELTVTDPAPLRAIGLSRGNTGTGLAEILFGLRFQAGYAEVREQGRYLADTQAARGDVFRIAVAGGRVIYSRNGTAFYTSTLTPSYPLNVDTSFFNAGSSFDAVKVGFGGTGTTGGGSTGGAVAAGITWKALVNAQLENAGVRKTSGCDGCPDAGGVSAQQVVNGGGVEITIRDVVRIAEIGLSPSGTWVGAGALPVAIRTGNGYAEIREGGRYRADVRVVNGDKLRVAIVDGRPVYSKNGKVFYRSSLRVGTPMFVQAVLYHRSAFLEAAAVPGS